MIYKCPTGHKVFTLQAGRWCPYCEQDYVPVDEAAGVLRSLDYTEDCEENQWLFFDLPLRRAAQHPVEPDEPTITLSAAEIRAMDKAYQSEHSNE